MSGSYYGSHLNQRIFRKIGIGIVGGMNDLGFLLWYGRGPLELTA